MLRAPLLYLAILAPLAPMPSCGSGGGGGLGGYLEVEVKAANLPTPHGYWVVRDLNADPAHNGITPRSLLRVRDREVVPISAVPDAGYHVIWHGTNDDTVTANANAFTAAAGGQVVVEFAP